MTSEILNLSGKPLEVGQTIYVSAASGRLRAQVLARPDERTVRVRFEATGREHEVALYRVVGLGVKRPSAIAGSKVRRAS